MSRVHGGARKAGHSSVAIAPVRLAVLEPTVRAALIPGQRAPLADPPGRPPISVETYVYANAGPDVFWLLPASRGSAESHQ